MTPKYGNCKDCAAWTWCGNHIGPKAGPCTLGPHTPTKMEYEGCWSFIPQVERSCETCLSNENPTHLCYACTHSALTDYWTPKPEKETE